MKSSLLCCFSLTLLSVGAFGQSTPLVKPAAASTPQPGVHFEKLEDYSGEAAVVEQLSRAYKFAADGTGSETYTAKVKIQSESALKQYSVLSMNFASSAQHVDIVYARVRHADGTVQETPATDAIEMPDPVTREAPFYSDLKQKQLPVRSLRAGDTLEWQMRVVRTKAEAEGQFWGQDSFVTDAVILSETIELRIPAGKTVTVWSPKLKATEATEGSEHVYRWSGSQLKPTAGKEAETEKEAKAKHVLTAEEEVDNEQGKLPTIAWTTFPNWEAVGAWYRGLEADRTQPDAEVKAKVAEVTAGKTTDEDRVRAVYGYVSSQIRYIGVAFGVGRYQPHQAADVLANQYGDCKDKHTLLAAMLRALGLKPDAVLIGAGIRFNQAVPSPAAFNHLITHVVVKDEPVWLDATTEVAPYRMLSFPTRDKQALIVPDTGVAHVETTPKDLPFATFQKMNAVGSLDENGTSNSHLTLVERGDAELLLRLAFRETAPAQYGQLMQQISRNIGYGGTVSNVEITRPDDTAEPFKITYDYKRDKAGDWPNLKTIPQLAPVDLSRPDDATPPVSSIQLGTLREESSTSAMKLPDGWGVELPEAVHQKSEYATYDETYRFEKGTLYAQRTIVVLKEKVPVAEWKSYKKWADAADVGNEQYVQLITNEQKRTAADSSGSAANNSEAQKLLGDAYTSFHSPNADLASIRQTLDKARALNDKQASLWEYYAYVDLRRGENSLAVEDFKKELNYHPERSDLYPGIVGLESSTGHRPDAEQTLNEWIKSDPKNPVPYAMLIGMLLEDKNGAQAMAIADQAEAAGASNGKDDETLTLAKGQAQLAGGATEKGTVTLVSLLKATESPLIMNNTAYVLADKGLELQTAESATRAALEKMGEESKAWTLDESPRVLVGKTTGIVATWDTMAWIFFREGKLDEAETYETAAWHNSLSTTEAEHMAAIAKARGAKNEALTYDELALETISPYDDMGVKKEPSDDQKRIEADAAALRKAGAKSSVPVKDGGAALQHLRAIPMGPAKVKGFAQYKLLLADGKIKRAEPAESKEVDGGKAKLEGLAIPSNFWPAGSQASLVSLATLNCFADKCELIFVH